MNAINTLHAGEFLYAFRMSNSLDPDQARHLFGSDLDPNCLQRLSADDTSRQRATINIGQPV